MAFAKRIGSLLKQSVSSTSSTFPAGRCMQSSMHFSRGRLIMGKETDKPIRSCFATFNSKENTTSVICDTDQKIYGHYGDQQQQVRSYSSPPSKQKQIIGGYRGPPPSGAGGYGAPPQSSRCNYGLASDIYLKSYFNSIRPPTSSTFGFRLGRCIILHFPKTTFIHLFAPRQPMQMRRNDSPKPGKEKGRWWGFEKVRPIACLQSSSDDRKKGKKEVAVSAKGHDRDKLNEIHSSLKKTQRYGYHVHSPLRKNNFSKLLRLSGAFKHVKQSGVANDLASLIENNDEAFKKTKLFKFLVPKKSTSSHVLKRTLPALRGL